MKMQLTVSFFSNLSMIAEVSEFKNQNKLTFHSLNAVNLTILS